MRVSANRRRRAQESLRGALDDRSGRRSRDDGGGGGGSDGGGGGGDFNAHIEQSLRWWRRCGDESTAHRLDERRRCVAKSGGQVDGDGGGDDGRGEELLLRALRHSLPTRRGRVLHRLPLSVHTQLPARKCTALALHDPHARARFRRRSK